jgi:hypothetical protein
MGWWAQLCAAPVPGGSGAGGGAVAGGGAAGAGRTIRGAPQATQNLLVGSFVAPQR